MSDTNISKGVQSDVCAFYGFTENKYYSFSKELDFISTNDMLKKGLLPIAINCMGDHFALKVSEENNGKIYFVYHDMNKKKLIAKTFLQFVSMCKSQKLGRIRTIEEGKRDLIAAGRGKK